MFVSKKDHDQLKKKVEDQDKVLREMMGHMAQLVQEIQELKKPKEPNYFG